MVKLCQSTISRLTQEMPLSNVLGLVDLQLVANDFINYWLEIFLIFNMRVSKMIIHYLYNES